MLAVLHPDIIASRGRVDSAGSKGLLPPPPLPDSPADAVGIWDLELGVTAMLLRGAIVDFKWGSQATVAIGCDPGLQNR